MILYRVVKESRFFCNKEIAETYRDPGLYKNCLLREVLFSEKQLQKVIFCEVVDLESRLSRRRVSQADIHIAEYRHGTWSQEFFLELPFISCRTLDQLPNLFEA